MSERSIVGEYLILYAYVMELVDMRDLGSRANRRVGSIPIVRTKVGACIG